MSVLLACALIAAALGGAILFAAITRSSPMPSMVVRRLHATFALAGSAAAIVWLVRTERPVSVITWDGAALAGVAAALGCGFWLDTRLSGSSRGMLVAIHASLGAAGVAILAVWLLD